jgi:dTDP-4-amino-4,6-dideoxygalactose transaminase
MKIPFNIPYISGGEITCITEAISHELSNNSISYSTKCRMLLKSKYEYNDLYLTQSCTAALEVGAILLDLKQGDEVIIPSYTFPSTANAFLRQGVKIVFTDCNSNYPVIDEGKIKSCITPDTKAIVPVHYGGFICNMDAIMKIAGEYGLFVIEDAAAAFDSKYKGKQAGTFGHLGCLSFHSTKNVHCGEGGAIIINDNRFFKKIVSILDKGTNKDELTNRVIDRYEWVSVGSSFRMSELHAAFLFDQLGKADWIKEKRRLLWDYYYKSLKILEEKNVLRLPVINKYLDYNAHMFYIILDNKERLTDLKKFLNENDIQATVHYTSLDCSKFWKDNFHSDRTNYNSQLFNDCLLRLPLYNSMETKEIAFVVMKIMEYFNV